MRTFLTAAAILGAALPLSAQIDHFTTSPEGYDFVEGNGVSNDLLGSRALLRYQQIDSTNLRSMTNRNRVAWRRDGWTPDDPTYGPRTIEMEMVLAESNLGNISTTFASNYIAGTQSTVVNRKFISFQDWSLRPALPPATETNIIFLDNQWSYAGKTATGTDLLWEVKIYSNDNLSNYPYDFELVNANASFGTKIPTRSTQTVLSTGCTATGRTSAFSVSCSILNDGTTFAWSSSTSNGVTGSPVVLFIDPVQQSLVLPQLCTSLEAIAASMLHGVGSATGATSVTTTFARHASMIGADLHMQAVTPDAGQPYAIQVALSRGIAVNVPADPVDPVIGRVWAYNPNAAIATVGPFPGGIILYTNHP